MSLPTNSLLAAFVSPALFAFGSAAVAVPVVIHLLTRRRFRRIRWAAMTFLVDAQKQNRRRVRIEELILLAIRCLAVLLIVMLIARPFVKPSGVAALLGGADRTDRVIVLDDSYSTALVGDSGTTFARIKKSTVNLLNRLREYAPTDTVTILLASKLDSPLVIGAVLDDQQLELILARLEAISPSQRRLSAESCIEAATDILSRDDTVTSAVVYLISDFQRVDWIDRASPTDEGPLDASELVAPLKKWAELDRAVSVLLIDASARSPQNLAITHAAGQQKQFVIGVDSVIEASVANFTQRDYEGLDVELSVGQVGAAAARLNRLPAGRTVAAELSATLAQAGDAAIRVHIEPDDLPIDNDRYLTVEVTDAVRILIVDGEPSADSYDDEAHLLATALRPQGTVFSGNTVDVISDAELDSAALDRYHLVILANVYRISEPAADALHRYVFAGGGLAIFLGDQVGDPQLYNLTLYRHGGGLLPAELNRIVTAPETGVALSGGDFRHPVVRVFSGRDNPFVRQIRFYRYYEMLPADATDSGSKLRPPANVIARFDDADQTPAIIERPYGRGRVMLFASSCDLEWNDWARDASYVVTMLEVARYLARSGSMHNDLMVGDPLKLAVDISRFDPAVRMRGPAYPQQQEVEITAVPDDSGGMQVEWAATDQAGIYSFVLRDTSGAEMIRRFAVNVDPHESDLTVATEDELKQAMTGVNVSYVRGVVASDDDSDQGRKELWPFVLVAALALLMVEQTLAWHFGRR